MRLTIALTVLVGVLATYGTPLFAAAYGPAGCGLGSVLLGKKPGFGQVFAVTTNGSSGSQTFGITSGTSNCVPANKAAAFNSQREFMDHNFATVVKEAAQGGGETLRAFAVTLGCAGEAVDRVAKAMQANHEQIFSVPGIDNVLFEAHAALRADAEIADRCHHII